MTIREGLLTPGVGITLFHESLVETKTFPSTIIGPQNVNPPKRFPYPRLTRSTAIPVFFDLIHPKKKEKKKENTALNSRDREIV